MKGTKAAKMEALKLYVEASRALEVRLVRAAVLRAACVLHRLLQHKQATHLDGFASRPSFRD